MTAFMLENGRLALAGGGRIRPVWLRGWRTVATAFLVFPAVVGGGAARADLDAEGPARSAARARAASRSRQVVRPRGAAWQELGPVERARYMKAVVTPRMKIVFQKFDARTFKTFGCSTCHGQSARARKFQMPSPNLYPLPSSPAALQAAVKENPSWPKWTKFMSEQVAPQMATLLGLPMFDPKTPWAGGFGCQNCHTIRTN
jgi:hypothetical protein